MKLPPASDPGWRGFSEHHDRFMKEYPKFEQHIMEEFQYLAERRERYANEDNDPDSSTEASTAWEFVSDWYSIEEQPFTVMVDSPLGDIKLAVSWHRSSMHPARKLCFSWDGVANSPFQLLVVLLSPSTLLPLAEPLALGPASAAGSKELPADLVEPNQSLAFRLILVDDKQEVVTEPKENRSPRSMTSRTPSVGQIVRQRLSLADHSRIVQQYKAAPKERRRPSVVYQPLSQNVQAIPLLEDRAAGSKDPFPLDQPLPAEWFGGHPVVLEFHPDRASELWYVSRKGAVKDIMMQFWGEEEQLGRPIKLGDRHALLPQIDFKKIVFIELYLREEDNER